MCICDRCGLNGHIAAQPTVRTTERGDGKRVPGWNSNRLPRKVGLTASQALRVRLLSLN